MSRRNLPPLPATRLFDQPRAVWATVFAATVGFMSIGLVDPILTSIASGLNASPSQVSLLFTSYFLVTAVMMLLTGFVSSRLGARATLILGAALIVVFAALAGTSHSVTQLVLFRGGWGLGNAFFVVTALSVLVAVTRGGTARAVLFYEAAIGLGLSGGPLVGAALGSYSWRWPFFGTATLMGVGLIAVALFLPSLPRPAQRISLTAPLAALRHPGLMIVACGAFFYYFAFFTVLAFAPFVLGMSPAEVGGIFFGWGLLLALFSVFVAPRAQARLGLVPLSAICLVVLAALVAAMGVLPAHLVAVCVVLSGAMMGICNTFFTQVALEISDAPRPVASAGYNFVRWFAGVIAPFAVPRIAENWGVGPAFGVAAASALVAPVLFALCRKKLRRPVAAAPEIAMPGIVAPVIAAVDGSASDAAVLARAGGLARAAGTGVLALHVRMAELIAEEAAELEDAEEAERIVAEACRRLSASGVAAQGRVLRAAAGSAAREVAETARAAGTRVLVVGAAHGSDLDDLMHGSFSAALVAIGVAGAEIVVTPAVPPERVRSTAEAIQAD